MLAERALEVVLRHTRPNEMDALRKDVESARADLEELQDSARLGNTVEELSLLTRELEESLESRDSYLAILRRIALGDCECAAEEARTAFTDGADETGGDDRSEDSTGRLQVWNRS